MQFWLVQVEPKINDIEIDNFGSTSFGFLGKLNHVGWVGSNPGVPELWKLVTL